MTMAQANQHHHVQFNTAEAGDEFGNDSEIIVSHSYEEDDNKIKVDVHLGFLQVNHRYEVIILLPKSIGCQLEPSDGHTNVHCQVLSTSEDDSTGGAVLTLEFFAYKEKLLKEELVLCRPDGSTVQLVFHARVLGRGKGTPLLKNGVRCVGVVEDEESEASDWQGFT